MRYKLGSGAPSVNVKTAKLSSSFVDNFDPVSERKSRAGAKRRNRWC